MTTPTKTDTRVNLWVYAIDDNGNPVYHVLHIGFFPSAIVARIIDRLNARGVAFHADYPGQSGIVDVVTCKMGPINNPEVHAARFNYEPRRILAEV